MNPLYFLTPMILASILSGRMRDPLLDTIASSEDVVAACAEAMGGWEAIKDFQTLTFDYPLRGGGAPVLWEVVWPNLVRQERENEFVFLFDGSRAGFLLGPKREDGTFPEPHLLAEEEWSIYELDVAQYFPAFFFLPWEDLGLVSLGETRVHQVKVVFPLSRAAVYSIDAEEFLPVRVDFPEMEFGMDLGDFRQIGGVLLPHRFSPVGDSENATIIERVRVNVELDRARFIFPPGIGKGTFEQPTSVNTGPPPARPSAAPEKPARLAGGAWGHDFSSRRALNLGTK
jgi:hypothetical protein